MRTVLIQNKSFDDYNFTELFFDALKRGVAQAEQLAAISRPNPEDMPPLPPQQPAPQTQRLGDDAGMRLLLPVGRSGWAIAAGYLGLFSLAVIPAPIALVIYRCRRTPR